MAGCREPGIGNRESGCSPSTLHRGAFGIWQALIIILIVGGMMTVALRYARLGTRHTADSYTREQAELFLQSATELALLEIEGYDRRSQGKCLDHLHILSRDGRFAADIAVTRYYLLEGSEDLALCGPLGYPVRTPESHGMVMLEAVVTTRPDGAKTGHPVRLVRRSLQRP
ncbi:hypothetical protein [Hydrogenimonas sp. SS33]|uniref:hypothetical protein n=1 Tax=Hydrogenimonas leucolamina TaxID=2954236 RepID=UPI00336BC43C